MPAVHIKTNVAYTEEQKTKVLKEITRVMVDVAHKNEEAVMATLLKVDGTMGNTDEPFVPHRGYSIHDERRGIQCGRSLAV